MAMVDTTVPTVTYSLAAGSYNATKTVTITASDAGGSNFGYMNVNVYKNDVFDADKSISLLTTSTTYSVTLDSDATWIVYTQVFDNAGNRQNQEPDNWDWYTQNYLIDTTAPTGTISTSYSSNTITANLSVSDNTGGSGLNSTYGWNHSTSSTCDSSIAFTNSTSTTYSFTISSINKYYICVRVIDNIGNVGYISTNITAGIMNYDYTGDYFGK